MRKYGYLPIFLDIKILLKINSEFIVLCVPNLVMERFSSQVEVPIKIYYHTALKVKIRFIFRRGVNIVNYAEKNFKL